MSGLLGKLAGQLASGSGGGGSSSASNNTQSGPGGLLHSLADKVTGQSHPQDRAGGSQQGYYPPGAPAPYGNQAPSYQQGYGGYNGNPYAQDHGPAGSDGHAGQRPYMSGYPQGNQERGAHGQQASGRGYEREGHGQGEGYGRYEQGQYGREQGHGGYQQGGQYGREQGHGGYPQGRGGHGKGDETYNQGYGRPRQGRGGH